VSTEPNKPIVLRTIKRAPAPAKPEPAAAPASPPPPASSGEPAQAGPEPAAAPKTDAVPAPAPEPAAASKPAPVPDSKPAPAAGPKHALVSLTAPAPAPSRPPAASAKRAEKTGIIFDCLEETPCPHCKAPVPLTGAKPLEPINCPACGGKLMVPGRVGGFLLTEHIGEGEMGTVYRAKDESLRREVAVKLVRGCRADEPESRERLLNEACAAGKLNHPNVAQVYALNFSNGHPYLVMELVTGEDFAHKLEREKRIDERTVLNMALDIADGLSALNREGLVHGDIKPGNIVLDRDGKAKLVDFGLSGMTRHKDGGLVGTPNYIAPELLKGSPDTHRSDLYSFGTTLYHLLSGRAPIEGERTIDILKARLLQQPVPLKSRASHVSAPTRKLVMQMIAREPEKRQADSDEVAAAIRDALEQLDGAPPAAGALSAAGRSVFQGPSLPVPPPPLTQPFWRSRAAISAALGLVAVLELAFAVKERSFYRSFEWYHRFAAERAKRAEELPVKPAEPAPKHEEPAPPPHDDFGQAALLERPDGKQPPSAAPAVSSSQETITLGDGHLWQSMNLGQPTQRGSTMLMGGTLIIQGAGTDMWKGCDRCRYVWATASSNYVFSAQVKALADNHAFAISGLLVKGGDPADGSGLLYGYLGSGELFLQIRDPNNKTTLVKRSERPLSVPRHLRLSRTGSVFEASFSEDGRAWTPFGSCELALPARNSVGLAVSAHETNALATAKFAAIDLSLTGAPAGAKPRAASPAAGAAKKAPAPAPARKR
jgi:tRNA A-37 threonylcarbamoyl transferase component Bud32/DNA-directed RNA polymerase subunit RPC12/RpoP